MAFLLVATAPGPHRPCIGLHYMQSTSLFSSPGHILCTNGKNSYGAGDSLWVGLDAPWAASQQLQLEWHFYTWQSEAYVPPSTQTPVCPVGEGVLLLYWNYMAENSYSTRSPSVRFEIMAISKVCRRAKIMFLWVNFWKGSATPQVTTAFFPICRDSRCDFTSPLPSIILSNLSLVPDKVFMCSAGKPSLDLVNKPGCLSTTLQRKDSMETQVPGSGGWVV